MFNFLNKKKSVEAKPEEDIAYLQKEPNLKFIDKIAEQLRSKEPIIEYHYKDDILYIINEQSCLYHIVNTTVKLEKLANSITAKEDNTLFDIGANVGIFAYFYKKKYPLSKAFLFEPDEKLLPIIKKNLSRFNDYKIVNSAISDFDGEIEFFYNPNSSQTNSTELEAILPFMQSSDVISNKVPCKKIESFCLEHNISSIDVLKIDIQGGEYKALKSSENVLGFTKQALVEVCFLMPETIPLINLMYEHYKKYEPINEIIMGADLKFFN